MLQTMPLSAISRWNWSLVYCHGILSVGRISRERSQRFAASSGCYHITSERDPSAFHATFVPFSICSMYASIPPAMILSRKRTAAARCSGPRIEFEIDIMGMKSAFVLSL